ncbi:MAG: hypothetical protein QXG03_01755 [Halalkalicoccus sp.]
MIRDWLAREREKAGGNPTTEDIAALSEDDALDALLRAKPGAAAFFWRDAPVTCYRLSLSRERFDRLRVVPGPERLGWRALAASERVRDCARRIDRADTDDLARETRIDVAAIERLAREGIPEEPLVLSTRRGAVPWRVADGNHRAVAAALRLRRGVAYQPVPAYLCVGANPVLKPLRERLLGFVPERWRPAGISKTG